MKWGFLFACVIVFLLVLLSLARGQEQLGPFKGADGGYHQHDPNWKGLWIAQDFSQCCGKADCEEANIGGVTVVRLQNGSGYMVQWPNQEAEFIPYQAPSVHPSQDGSYWVCHKWVGGDGVKSVRCLFTPPLGF